MLVLRNATYLITRKMEFFNIPGASPFFPNLYGQSGM